MDAENSERQPLIKKNLIVPMTRTNREKNNGAENALRLNLYRSSQENHEGNSYAVKSVPESEKIIFSWSEINVFTLTNGSGGLGFLRNCFKNDSNPKQGKQILKTVSGIAYPGELLAILGSSGAGKTTLLNTLTSRSSSRLIISGLRCANGVPVSSSTLTSQLAYVQQQDLFIGSLTVKEHLIFQALVRMDRHIPYQQRMQRVEEVISELGLTDCENTVIGIPGRLKGISGGEMKRLSFAAEVLTNPSLMFCDEPTSGLDSFMTLNVVQVLKRLAQKGKTIVCTIHQPSSEVYAMFDKILLMAEGRAAFLGTPDEADKFFTSLDAPCPHNYNPADYFVQLLAILPGREESCKQAVNMICDSFERSEYGIKVAVEAATVVDSEYNYDFMYNGKGKRNRYKATWCSQFRAVLWRSWISVLKEPLLIKVRLLQTIITALIVGSIYFGQTLNQDGVMNINGALFIFLTTMTFQNVFAVISVFCSELPILMREHKNGMYRVDVYFISKVLAETPVFIAIPVIYITICYYLIGLNTDSDRFFVAAGIIILVANVSVSFGYLASCISSTVSMALSIAPPLMIPFLLFGGFFLNIDSIPVYFRWLSYLSWFRYGNEALLINQWRGVTNISCSNTANLTCPKNGHVVLEVLNFSESNLIPDIIALVGLICGFRLVAYIALLIKTCSIS